jgi:hypothetical protein
MYAFQFGTSLVVPWIPFASVLVSYTKNEPYNYTHDRTFVPWLNSEFEGRTLPTETAYVNNGESLGYYIPPNSDEILFRLQTMPTMHSMAHFQYQMIRRGATHGSSAVDGSHLLSELSPHDRKKDPVLRKFFLRDGAYQWQHIFRIGGEYSLSRVNIPIRVFGEAGVVYSYYTNIEGEANSGTASAYRKINTSVYPAATGFIASIGFRLYMW